MQNSFDTSEKVLIFAYILGHSEDEKLMLVGTVALTAVIKTITSQLHEH